MPSHSGQVSLLPILVEPTTFAAVSQGCHVFCQFLKSPRPPFTSPLNCGFGTALIGTGGEAQFTVQCLCYFCSRTLTSPLFLPFRPSGDILYVKCNINTCQHRPFKCSAVRKGCFQNFAFRGASISVSRGKSKCFVQIIWCKFN